jgi:hypothetical protein
MGSGWRILCSPTNTCLRLESEAWPTKVQLSETGAGQVRACPGLQVSFLRETQPSAERAWTGHRPWEEVRLPSLPKG